MCFAVGKALKCFFHNNFRLTLSPASEWSKWSVALSFPWLLRSLGPCTRGTCRTGDLSVCRAVRDEMTHSCIRIVSSLGGKGTITVWATALTTTFDDPDRFRGCKGRKSSPSPRGRCTACAAQRMVGDNFMLELPFSTRSPPTCLSNYFSSVYSTIFRCHLASWCH